MKWGGQNSSGTGTVTGTCVYQAATLASRTSFGTGCNGSQGQVTLTADQDPWTNRTVTLQLNNTLPATMSVFVVGFTQVNLPLGAVHPAANPGCSMLVSNDVVIMLPVPALPVTLPNDPALAGVQAHAQAATVEFNGASISGIASSNGVTFTLGAL